MMYINNVSISHFISSANILVSRKKSILLVSAIACAIFLTATIFWMCSGFWENYVVDHLKLNGQRFAIPAIVSPSFEKRGHPALHVKKKDQKSLLSILLDDAFKEIKSLQQQLQEASKETVEALAIKDKNLSLYVEVKERMKAVEDEFAEQQLKYQELKEENNRLNTEINDLYHLIGRRPNNLFVDADSPEDDI